MCKQLPLARIHTQPGVGGKIVRRRSFCMSVCCQQDKVNKNVSAKWACNGGEINKT